MSAGSLGSTCCSGCSGGGSSSSSKRLPFAESYLTLCKEVNATPLCEVKGYLGKPILELSADRIKLDDWKLLLKALAGDRSLHYIAIKSKHPNKSVLEQMTTETAARICKRPVLYTKFVMTTFAEALSKSVSVSRNLSSLLLSSIPIKSEYLAILCEGIGKNKSLQHLALQHCPIFDNGCFELCKTLQNKSNLITLDMTNCGITHEGAAYVADLIKMQSTARFGESWKCSLRYSCVDSNELPGLRRITLNQNTSIGDNGLNAIIQVLFDDIWIRAIDMQQCGITEKGCESVVELIKTNKELEIFDLRANNLQDLYVLRQLMAGLKENLTVNNGKFKFRWMDEVKTITASISQMSLATNIQPTPRRHSQSNNLSNTKSEVSFKSLDSDAPWRTTAPKPKSMFTLNKRKKARSNLTRSKSMDPISWSSQTSIRGRAKKSLQGPSSHRLNTTESENHELGDEKEIDDDNSIASKNGLSKQKTFVGVGVTEEQFKILNEFKQYSAALINPQNKLSEEEQKKNQDIKVNDYFARQQMGEKLSDSTSKGEPNQEGGDSSSVPKVNRAQELFNMLLLNRKKSSSSISNASECSGKTISFGGSPSPSFLGNEITAKVVPQQTFRLGAIPEVKHDQQFKEPSQFGSQASVKMANCLRPDPEDLKRRDLHPLRATMSSVLLRPEDPLRRELQMTSSALALSQHVTHKRS